MVAVGSVPDDVYEIFNSMVDHGIRINLEDVRRTTASAGSQSATNLELFNNSKKMRQK
jgi:hypothetical protein